MRRISQMIKHHRHAKWALTDQAVVSGSNFVIGILLARFLGPEAFGMFVLLQSVILYFNSFQGALIFQPMMSAAPQLSGAKKLAYLQGVFALQLALTLTLAGIIGLMALLANWLSIKDFVNIDSNIIYAVIATLLAFQLQDWQRRYYFVQEKADSAFIIDLISYGVQITLLGYASFSQVLNIGMAFWIIAGASFVAFSLGFIRDQLQPVFNHARSVLKDGWRTGRDYLIAWQLQWLGTQGVLVLGAGVIGAQAVGGVRAAQNIVGPINILFLAMENVIPVMAAKRFAQSGITGLLAYLVRITAFGSALLIPVLILIAIFATPIIHLLYGDLYAGSASLVLWQVGSIFLQFYLRQLCFFLRTVSASSVIIRSGIVMSITSVVVALFTINQYHATAVMAALLSGTAAGLIYSFIAALKITRRAQANASNTVAPLNEMEYGS